MLSFALICYNNKVLWYFVYLSEMSLWRIRWLRCLKFIFVYYFKKWMFDDTDHHGVYSYAKIYQDVWWYSYITKQMFGDITVKIKQYWVNTHYVSSFDYFTIQIRFEKQKWNGERYFNSVYAKFAKNNVANSLKFR